MTVEELVAHIKELDQVLMKFRNESMYDRVKNNVGEGVGVPLYEGPIQRFARFWYSYSINRLFAKVFRRFVDALAQSFIWSISGNFLSLFTMLIAGYADKESASLYLLISLVLVLFILITISELYGEHMKRNMPDDLIIQYTKVKAD